MGVRATPKQGGLDRVAGGGGANAVHLGMHSSSVGAVGTVSFPETAGGLSRPVNFRPGRKAISQNRG